MEEFALEPKQQLSDLQGTLKNTKNKVVPFFLKNKKWSIVLIALVFIIVAAYIAGAYLMNPRDTVTSFEQAVRNGDVKTLKGLIHSPESQVKVDEKHLKDLITYSKENEEYLPKIVGNMMAQINDEENGIPNPGGATDFYLKKTSIPLFYSHFTIQFRPYFLELSTNEAGSTLKLDNKKVFQTTDKEKKHTIGPLMPGIYKTSAEKKFQYALLSQENSVTAFDDENATSTSDLELYGGSLELESNFENTSIFINGKSINQTIKTMPKIGPISFNGTIRIHGEQQFPWGLEKSAEALVEQETSSVNITPVPFATNATRKPIITLINNYSKQELLALVNHDPNKFTTIGDSLKARFIETINNNVQYKETWKGKALGTRIDFDNVTLSLNEETKIYEATVPVEIHAKYRKYSSYDSGDEPLEDKVDYYKLTLSYNEKTKTWLITDKEDQYSNTSNYFNGKNTVKSEFK
jgi:hypothetical protein